MKMLKIILISLIISNLMFANDDIFSSTKSVKDILAEKKVEKEEPDEFKTLLDNERLKKQMDIEKENRKKEKNLSKIEDQKKDKLLMKIDSQIYKEQTRVAKKLQKLKKYKKCIEDAVSEEDLKNCKRNRNK